MCPSPPSQDQSSVFEVAVRLDRAVRLNELAQERTTPYERWNATDLIREAIDFYLNEVDEEDWGHLTKSDVREVLQEELDSQLD